MIRAKYIRFGHNKTNPDNPQYKDECVNDVIEEIVLLQPGLSGQYQIVVSRAALLDEVQVRCELQPAARHLSEAAVAEIAGALQQRIKNLVGISCAVAVLAPEAIERTLTGKARRVFDKRVAPP